MELNSTSTTADVATTTGRPSPRTQSVAVDVRVRIGKVSVERERNRCLKTGFLRGEGADMITLKIDEYLVVNSYTKSKRWLSKRPNRAKANEIIVHIKGTVKYPEPVFVADFGELTVNEAEVFAQATME